MYTPRGVVACLVALLASGVVAAQSPGWVVPPGMESSVMAMFRGPFSGGACRLQGASLERERVVATYRCEGGATAAVIDAMHPTRSPPDATRTEQFALSLRAGSSAPPSLLTGLAASVRAGEASWRWARIEAAPRRPVDPPAAPAPTLDPSALDGAQRDRLRAAFEAYRSRRYAESREALRELTRAVTCCGAIDLLIASIASAPPAASPAHRDGASAAGDAIDELVMAAEGYYAAHDERVSAGEKRALYAAAAQRLRRVCDALPALAAPRALLASALARSGDTRGAGEALDGVDRMSPTVPERLLHRAALVQHQDRRRATALLDAYLRELAALEARGAVVDPGTVPRVRALRAELSSAPTHPSVDLFDPQPGDLARRHAATTSVPPTTQARREALAIALAAALLGGGWWIAARRRNRGEPTV